MNSKASSSYDVNLPLKFKWAFCLDHPRYGNPKLINEVSHDVVFYTDECIWLPNKIGKIKVAWMLEPPEYSPQTFEWISINYKEFDYVFTWDKELLKIDKRFIFYPPGNSWVPREEIGIYPKNKNISIVASFKNFMAGHKLRHNIINTYKQKYDIDWYGRRDILYSDKNYIAPFDKNVQNTVENILDAYKDYMFTIVVENSIRDYAFSEKIVTPIMAGTIPIYNGCKSIGDFFDTRGIITFDTLEELDNILGSLNEQKYNEMLPYVKENFERGKNYQLMEDYIFNKLLEMDLITEQ
jgi:hypothetical protein